MNSNGNKQILVTLPNNMSNIPEATLLLNLFSMYHCQLKITIILFFSILLGGKWLAL